jgi:RNA polymerase sigma-70 factor (ECF subfamily)
LAFVIRHLAWPFGSEFMPIIPTLALCASPATLNPVSTNRLDSDSSPTSPSSEAAAPRPAFVTTHWSVVLSAQNQNVAKSSAALETLCRTYWYPLYAYARRAGHAPADAEDLTQSFFARLLEKDYLLSAAREKGKFRTFLLVALKRFLANEWDRQHAQKRGGFAPIVSIDHDTAESRFAAEPSHNLQPDLLFDRQWALTLLDRTMTRLQQEYVATGRSRLFESLRNLLVKDDSASTYAEIAARLNLTEPAVKMAVHRLRTRYRDVLREEIAQTVTSSAEVEEEIRHLFSAFGQ